MTVTLASFPWCIIWTSAAALLLTSALLYNVGAHAAIVMVMVRICGRMSSTTLNCSSVMSDRAGAAHVWLHAWPCVLSLNPSSFLSSSLLFIVFSLTYSFGHRGRDRRKNAGEGFWQSAMSPLWFSQTLHLPSFLCHPTQTALLWFSHLSSSLSRSLSLPLAVMNLKYVFVLVLFSKLASIGDEPLAL